MMKANKHEQIYVLGYIRTWNEATRNNKLLLVAKPGLQIQNDPYIDPAV
jgi:hypothetical protein